MFVARLLWLFALTIAAACSSCSSSPSDYSDYNFRSLAEFSDVVADAGWSCALADDQPKTDAALERNGWTFAVCSRGAIAIYASDSKRQEITSLPQNRLEPGKASLTGGNWSVIGDQFVVEDAEKKLGGTLTVIK